jgi:hypothetical protein
MKETKGNMKKLIFAFACCSLLACNLLSNKIEVEVINKSEKSIKNLKLYTSENKEMARFDEIAPNQAKSGFISMAENKTDGHYILEFTNEKGENKKAQGGYYSNGTPLNDKIIFEIQKDTVVTRSN